VQNAISPYHYRWEDSTGTVIANTINIQNIPGGRYRFKFKDGSACDTLVTSFLVVQNNGDIKIDSTAKQVQVAGCGLSNGAISGITVTGGDSYKWKNQSGVVVSNNLALQGVPGGIYQLSIINSFGCSLNTTFIIPNASFEPIQVTTHQLVPASCDLNNGSIHITQFSANPAPYQMHWKDSASGTLFYGNPLNNLPTGTYQLIAKDKHHLI